MDIIILLYAISPLRGHRKRKSDDREGKKAPKRSKMGGGGGKKSSRGFNKPGTKTGKTGAKKETSKIGKKRPAK